MVLVAEQDPTEQKICFYCGLPIQMGNGRIVPLDRPYANLWTHREICNDAVTKDWLNENIEKILEYVQGLPVVHKTPNKRGRK